jgi:hypothetical protein
VNLSRFNFFICDINYYAQATSKLFSLACFVDVGRKNQLVINSGNNSKKRQGCGRNKNGRPDIFQADQNSEENQNTLTIIWEEKMQHSLANFYSLNIKMSAIFGHLVQLVFHAREVFYRSFR